MRGIRISDRQSEMMGIDNHHGYIGSFTREQAVGAIPNGTRVRKINSQVSDSHHDGDMGAVIGSINTEDFLKDDYPDVTHVYFVEWDDEPLTVIGTTSRKIEAV